MIDRAGVRIGIDLGGTKIAAIAIDRDGRMLAELRRASPQGDYEATLVALVRTVEQLEAETGSAGARVGIGMPGSIAPKSGRVQNANSTWLNGRPLAADLEHRLGPRVRFANDANCFALSEATDGAAAGDTRVLGVILGTGCGSGVVVARQIMDGPRGIGGEWGHNPLPWPSRKNGRDRSAGAAGRVAWKLGFQVRRSPLIMPAALARCWTRPRSPSARTREMRRRAPRSTGMRIGWRADWLPS